MTCIVQSSQDLKINYTNFFFNTQVISAIEAICGQRLPDCFPLYLGGLASDPQSFKNILIGLFGS